MLALTATAAYTRKQRTVLQSSVFSCGGEDGGYDEACYGEEDRDMKKGRDASTTKIRKWVTLSARSGCGHAYGSRPEVASDGGIGEPSVLKNCK